jgi:cholesterol transport system auxiliary component
VNLFQRNTAALFVVLTIGACSITRPPPVKQTFLLQVDAAAAPSPAPRPGSLKVTTFRVAPQFEGKGLVYRTDDLRFEADFYNEFFIQPGAMVTDRIAAVLSRNRVFEVVAGPESRLQADVELRGVVTELYADLRDPRAPAAVLSMQVVLLRADPLPERVLYNETLTRRAALPDGSPDAVVRGLSSALQDMLGDLQARLRDVPLAPTSST